jgi:hypothetical protein
MDFITYKNEKWPLRVSYYALKQYQIETGKGIETLEDDIANLEILLHHSIVAGCKAENKACTLTRADMEFMLDESLSDFNKILTGSFPDATKGAANKKK